MSSNKKYVLGADPGKHGAIVLIPENFKLGDVLSPDNDDIVIIPTKVKDGKVDVQFMYDSLLPYKDRISMVVMEKVHAIFGSSAVSTFEFGDSNGSMRTVLKLIVGPKCPFHIILPKYWQESSWQLIDIIYGEPIMDKATGKQKVRQDGSLRFKTDTKGTSSRAAHFVFPGISFVPKRCKKEHDGCVDAALIAYHGTCLKS